MTEPTANRAVATVKIDNDHVRVTEWRFAPGVSDAHEARWAGPYSPFAPRMALFRTVLRMSS